MATMTDQDNLRDRIATVIAGEEDYPHPRGYAAHAQAIIDELGLTTETHAATHSKRTMTRTIGAWEWDNQ